MTTDRSSGSTLVIKSPLFLQQPLALRGRSVLQNACRRSPPLRQHLSSMISPTSTRHRKLNYAFLSSLIILATKSFSASALDNGDDSVPNTIKVAAYYGPRSYHERNGLFRPDNIDYSKLSRIMYGPYAMNEHGNIWGKDVNADPQLLFGPPNWNPEPNAQKNCYQSSPDNQPLCAHYQHILMAWMYFQTLVDQIIVINLQKWLLILVHDLGSPKMQFSS